MKINRRRLLQGGAAAGAALGTHPILRAMFSPRHANAAAPPDAIFVIFQLEGGNDGLNTCIPTDDVGHDQRQIYDSVRPNLGVPVADLIDVDPAKNLDPDPVRGTGLGLHPSMPELRQMWKDGVLGVVNGVAYPDQNLSHFRSEDIWFGGIPASDPFDTGWFGRYLDEQFTSSDLVTVGIDGNLSKNFTCAGCNVLAVSRLSQFALPDDEDFPDLDAKADALAAIYGIESGGATSGLQNQIGTTGDVMLSKLDDYGDIATNWASNLDAVSGRTAKRAKEIASIIRHDELALGTPVGARFFHFRLGGFDTHTGQTDPGQQGKAGRQADLLAQVSQIMKAFYDDMVAIGCADKVLMMTQSEFGRRTAENGNLGTDHGQASVLFVAGDPVQKGVYGELPPLDDLDNGNLKWKVDFRQVYATIIDDWLGADHTTLMDDGPYTKIPFIAP